MGPMKPIGFRPFIGGEITLPITIGSGPTLYSGGWKNPTQSDLLDVSADHSAQILPKLIKNPPNV